MTRETGSTTVEALEHTISATFGVQASQTVTKGYCVTQDSIGNVSLSVDSVSVGSFVGVCDKTATGTTVPGAVTTNVITHGLVWVSSSTGAIAMGAPLVIASTNVGCVTSGSYAGLIAAGNQSYIVGTSWSTTSTGDVPILMRIA